MFYEDTKAPFLSYQNQGYYSVGTKKFLFKYNAVVESTKTNLPINWTFNDEVYQTIDWTKKSGRNLLDSYKLRAQQLRDKYDYIIISYSGGVDSCAMLDAFLLNGIKVDEIWCDWPVRLTEISRASVSKNIHHSNYHSEFFLNTFPKLQEISKQYPNIKIHVSDEFSKGYIEDFEDTAYIFSVPQHLHGTSRFRYITKYMHNMMQDTNKSVALLVGSDKPNIYLSSKNNVGMLFIDTAANQKSDLNDYCSRIIEYFYWSPDMPQLVVDQCHAIIDYLKENPIEFKKIESSMRTLKNTFNDRTLLYNLITIKVCYPNWKNDFQTNKPPFGRSSLCFVPLLKPFYNEDFLKVHFNRFDDDIKKITKPNDSNADHPTPMEAYWKFYPITHVSNILGKELHDF